MKKIIICSTNPVKINAVKKGFEKMFPKKNFNFVGVSSLSNVSDQPFSDDETFRGAKNRVNDAFIKFQDADFYVGIEGGIESIKNEMQAFAWVFIKTKTKIGKAKTATFFLPKKVVKLIKQGKELGEADDIVFNRQNSKQERLYRICFTKIKLIFD